MNTLRLELRSPLRRLSAGIWLSFLVMTVVFGQSTSTDVRDLKFDKSLERKIKRAELHDYKLSLHSQQVLSVELEEQSFDVKVELFRAGDYKSVATANIGSGFDREHLIFIAEESDEYLLRISPSENEFGNGSYRFSARLAERLTETNKTRIEALRLLEEAVESQKENTALKIREAISKREQALMLWQQIGDKYWEGHTLERLGTAHNALLENNKAVDYLNRALVKAQAYGDKLQEAATLNSIGQITNGFGEPQQAIDYHNQALRIFQAARNNVGIINSMNLVGNAHVGLKDYPKANEYFHSSLAIAQKLGNKDFEAVCTYFLGTALEAQNEKAKAVAQYNRSLALWREIGNNRGVPLALVRIGRIQTAEGANDEALKNLNEASKLFQLEKNRNQEAVTYSSLYNVLAKLGKTQEGIDAQKKSLAYWQEIKFRYLEITTTGLLASIYNSLGDYKEAVKYADMCLATEATLPERAAESLRKQFEAEMRQTKASTMMTLASIYFNSGDTEKSLQYYNYALTVFEGQKENLSKSFAMLAHSNMAEVYSYNYDWLKALEHQNRALSLANELKNQSFIVKTINSIGLIYDRTGERRKALQSYEQALELMASIKEKGDTEKNYEGAILGNIGSKWLFLGEPQKALEYHQRELTLRLTIKDPRFIDGQSSAYQSLANVHSFLGENEKALELLYKSLELFRQAPQHIKDLGRNRITEAIILKDIGSIYRQTGNLKKAHDIFNQSLRIARETKRVQMEASSLSNIGLVDLAFGEPRTALQNFRLALEMSRQIKNKPSEPIFLNNIAQVYSYWGKQQEVLKYTEQALKIAEEIGDKNLVSTCLHNIGGAYLATGENEKASDYYIRSLKISEQIGDKRGEAITLNDLAHLYSNTGDRGKSLRSYEQSLSIIRSIGDKTNVAVILGNMAFDYAELGDYQKALELREEALRTTREIGDKLGEIVQLLGLGGIHRKLGEQNKSVADLEKAITNYEQALKLSRETESKSGEASALHGLGQSYIEMNNPQGALSFLNEALTDSKQLQRKFFEDAIYVSLGTLHEKTKAYDKAIEAYQQSLILAQVITDKDIEAKALNGLMSSWKARGNAHLAIFYGKQAVNKYQELRGSIRSLRRETQNIYRDKVTDTYRELADLLIAVGQLREAEQVLAMLKEQEAFEFVRRDADEAEELLSKRSIPDPTEQKAIAEYVRLSNELTAKSQRFDALSLKLDLSKTEEAEKKRLEQEVADAKEGVLVFFRSLESEFTKKTAKGGTITGESIDDLRKELRRIGPDVILISTYLLPQRYRAIVSTGNTMVDRKKEYQPLNLDAEKVNKKIMEFKQALQDPRQDPKPLGKELYDIFFKPIERDIENAKATTLLWSLDGSLRYIPVGALYDGRQFLAERYENVFVTLAVGRDSQLFAQQPRTEWHVLGLGVSKPYKPFKELPSVPFELRTIVRDERVSQDKQGVLAGIRLLDSEFTEESFVNNLRPDKAFNVVHLATHFQLGSNLDNSGLLLGDGEILSLYTINKMDRRFDFKNVELLALSACETGVTIGNSNGREVESLGMIAQKNGAKAILATLWRVADTSTAILMSEFYRLRKTNPRLTKSQALQMAQKEMIEGKLLPPAVTEIRRDTGEMEQLPTNAPRYAADPKRPYTHPYYWAPFILIGNWR